MYIEMRRLYIILACLMFISCTSYSKEDISETNNQKISFESEKRIKLRCHNNDWYINYTLVCNYIDKEHFLIHIHCEKIGCYKIQ